MQVAPTTPLSPRKRRAIRPPAASGNHRAQMADHRVVAFTRATPVNIAVPATHRAELRTQVGPQGIENRVAERHASGLVANQRGKDVALAQINSHRGTQRLLPFTQKNATIDKTCAKEAGQLLLKDAGPAA